jgi:hypothetical protein
MEWNWRGAEAPPHPLLALARWAVVFLLRRIGMSRPILRRHKPACFGAAVVRRAFCLRHFISPANQREMRCEKTPPVEASGVFLAGQCG